MSAWLASLSLALWAVTMAPPQLRSQSRDVDPTPSVDHHAHLKSPAIARLFHVRLPAVELPPALDRVLRDFERHWHARDQAALTELFTDDGIMQFGDAWRRGRSAIHIALLDSRGADLRLWAQAFEAKDSLAYIVGSYGHRTLPHLSDLGRMHLSLRLERDGVWRIAAAVLGNVNPPSPSDSATFPADVLIAQLDSAGLRRAAVMSWAYQFGAPSFDVVDEYAKVQEENDWTARQVARYPDRLAAFCSFNPLENYALEELHRCMNAGSFVGIKLHFTTSFVDLRNSGHVERLQQVFRAANARRAPIVVHIRTLHRAYGGTDADIFLRDVLGEAPDVPVQIAHAAGWGGYGPETDAALAIFADAAERNDPRMANVYFDLSGVASRALPDSMKQVLTNRIRTIGIHRMLFALDLVEQGSQRRREAWEAFILLPLESAEVKTIAANVAPYLR